MTIKQWLKEEGVKWDESYTDNNGTTEYVERFADGGHKVIAKSTKDFTGGYLDLTIKFTHPETGKFLEYNGCSDDKHVWEALENMELQW